MLLLGLIGGVVAVLVYQRIQERQAEPAMEDLDEKVSLHLSELEDRMAEVADSA